MGPITRSQAASSDNGNSLAASATTPVNLPEIVTAPLARVLTDIADDATSHGRDAMSEAIYQSTSHLAQHVNRGNAVLAEGFNETKQEPGPATTGPTDRILFSALTVAALTIIHGSVSLHEGNPAAQILNRVYGAAELGCDEQEESTPPIPARLYLGTIKGTRVFLTDDQNNAVNVGTSALYPIVAIQAAFGTGKTVVGAMITWLQSVTSSVIVTASTNAAVAQFAETVKSIAEFADVQLIRYVSDSAAAEERVPLPVDLDEVLKNLGETYETRLTSDQLKTCRKFREVRIRYEYYAAREDGLLEIPEDEREKYM
ncbi:unnamed protein product, partial [Heligmosomoides polygyrus]|uniref:AAA_11 domain-containing protein n=1 Tax=Heligmosomoides polygyrus TaxID=6339 RepID=A0A183F544_HELPZ